MFIKATVKRYTWVFLLPFLFFSQLSAKHVSSKEVHNNKNHNTLRTTLAPKLNDIDRIDFVLSKYKKLKQSVSLTNETWSRFEEWMTKKALFLGSRYYDHNLVYKEIPQLSSARNFRANYQRFVLSILTKPRAQQTAPSVGSTRNISILYCGNYGAGHKSPATALAQSLQKAGHKVLLIDIDVLQNKYSPRVDGYSRTDVYGEIYQKEGNEKKAREISRRIELAHKPDQRKFMGDLKKEIVDFKTDFIFAVAHHRPSLAYLSYQLGIPMTFVHTDHRFKSCLVPILQEQLKLKKPLVSFTALSDQKAFLEPVYNALKITSSKLPPAVQKQIVRLDFPVRESFVPATPKEIASIRQQLHIPKDRTVCKLAMGQNALSDEVNKVLQLLFKQEKSMKKPMHVFVICGKNDALKAELEKSIKARRSKQKNSKLDIKICGFMEEQKMAQIDKVSDVWITKPGGSTTSELVQTQKQMLYVLAAHPWEASNAQYLERLNLAQRLSASTPIFKQVENRLNAHKKLNLKKLPPIKWQIQANRIATSSQMR